MDPRLKAFVDAFRAMQTGTGAGELVERANRFSSDPGDQDKFVEAVFSIDSRRAAEILGFDADELNEAIELHSKAGPHDESAEDLPGVSVEVVARASLRRALGDAVFNNLCLDAHRALLEAERLCLDTSSVMQGDSIVLDLVRAFEHQLDHVLFEPLLKYLEETGLQPSGGLGPDHQSWKKLVNREATLGSKLVILRDPPLELEKICNARTADLGKLTEAVKYVKDVRNDVSHGKVYTRAEALAIRSRCFGTTSDGGIFALLAEQKA